MIDYKYKDLYLEDSIDKQLKLTFSGGEVVTNEDIYAEDMELTETLCSESNLRFGACEASVFKIKIANSFTSHVGQSLTVIETLGVHTDEPFTFGTYKVHSDKPTADKRYRDIEAYDAMYDIINAEVSDWYNSILPDSNTTMTLKAFRDSFFAHFGIEQEETILVNDSMVVSKTVDSSEMSGKDVITAICEINGAFGHIGRNGKFQYIVLKELTEDLYPTNDLYPANDLYPSIASNSERIEKQHYISCQYEDYKTKKISKLQIRQEEDDIGCIYGDGDNCYIVQGNFLLYGKSAEELNTIAANMYSVISLAYFRPSTIEAKGNPCLMVGDGIRLFTKYKEIYTYILQRTLSGIQALKDTYSADGEEEYAEKVNGVQKSIKQLVGKTNRLVRNVGEISSEIEELESNTSTMFEQTANSISMQANQITSINDNLVEMGSSIKLNTKNIGLKVSKGDVSSQISLETGEISIVGNRLVIESDNFKLSKYGEVEASGSFTSNNTNSNGNIISAVVQGGAIALLRDNSESLKIMSGSSGDLQGGKIGVKDFLIIGDIGSTAGYMYDISESVLSGIRHIFNGQIRANGNVQVGANGSYYSSEGKVSVSANAGKGGYGVYLEGIYTLVQNENGEYAPIYASAFNNSSSRKYKENFSDISEKEAEKLLEIAPLHFDYINGKKNQAGFIAEDIENIFPDTCAYMKNKETGEEELYGLDYSKFIPYMVKLMQMQDKKIKELEKRLEELEHE